MGSGVAVGGGGVNVGGSGSVASGVRMISFAAGMAVFVGGKSVVGVADGVSKKLKSAVTATVGRMATSCLGDPKS